MSKVHVEASDIIEARPEEVYEVMSDYRVGHPAILPKPYFVELHIEKGGRGAGTVFRAKMKVWGQESTYHMIVAEPEPGRIMTEASLDSDLITTFRIDPLNDGKHSRVTITTDFTASPGVQGFMEKLFQPSVAGGIYKKELRQLASYLASKTAVAK